MFWVAAASMAYYAIRLGNVQQHKEWMIRTYVLACNGVVGDRILADIPVLARHIGIDAVNDLSGWVLWTHIFRNSPTWFRFQSRSEFRIVAFGALRCHRILSAGQSLGRPKCEEPAYAKVGC
jgi:Predicted membrane protein (DUF2306)